MTTTRPENMKLNVVICMEMDGQHAELMRLDISDDCASIFLAKGGKSTAMNILRCAIRELEQRFDDTPIPRCTSRLN